MALTPPPTAPSTTDPATFATRADALVAWHATNVTELAALQTDVTASSSTAIAAANFKGTWASRTGAANVPYCVSHLSKYWMLQSNIADITVKVPGTASEWQEILGAATFAGIVAQGGNLTGAMNEARGTVAMHATTMDIWTGKPAILDGTGSAVTITAIANAPQAGARRTLYPIAGTVITNGATFAVDGEANYTTASGDGLEFEAVTTSTYKVHVIKSEGVNGTPAGAVMHFARNSAPSGWLKANGAAVSRTTYSTLFTAIGTTFGVGDGSTTFNVPDLRGEFIRVWDDSRGIDSGRAFGSAQAQDIQPHTHTVTAMTDNATNGSNVRGTAGSSVQGTSNSGSTGTTETRPRNIALLACIKY